MGNQAAADTRLTNANFLIRETCPGCHGGDQAILYRCEFTESPIREHVREYHLSDAEGASYVLAECGRCSLIYQREVAGPDLMQRIYDDPRGQRPRRGPTLAQRYRHAYEVMRVTRYLELPPEEIKILDFGMGRGEWVLVARAFGCDAYGFDISERHSEFAAKNNVPVLGREELGEHRFDFINTEQVFEHLADPLDTLILLKGALKPGGMIKISVPNGRKFKRAIRRIDHLDFGAIKPAQPLIHVNCFTRASLIGMAEAAEMREVFPPMIRLNRRKIMTSTAATLYRRLRHGMKGGTYLFLRKK